MRKPKPIILIVEDDTELRRLYEIRLKKAGLQVETATNGEDAILDAIKKHPNFIILDLMLPRQGGIQVMRILKSNPLTKDIPILVLTAYDQFSYRRDSQAHVVDYILKTDTTPQKIVEIVKAYLAARQQ